MEYVFRQLLEHAGCPSLGTQGPLRRFPDVKLPADASKIFLHFPVAAINTAPNKPEGPFGEHLAKEMMCLIEAFEFVQTDDIRFLHMSPGITKEEIDVGDGNSSTRHCRSFSTHFFS